MEPKLEANSDNSTRSSEHTRRWWRWGCVLAFAAGIVMGAPALRSTFLSGDDIQLVRDHVLVNHPSLEHAARLFTVFHRDLYQPVALLSLSLEFAVIRALGLPAEASGMPPAAWLFHLTNIILHGLNALLVCVLLRRITRRPAVAITAAVIFALHPIGVETVAWLNGRMMLLSTFFLLAAIIHMDRVQATGKWFDIGLAVLFTALCMMSKVRVSAPVLMAVPLVFRWERPSVRWWSTWVLVTVVTGVFVAVNYSASSAMILEGTEYLQGSRLARALEALAWYWGHIIVPVGLAPYHPAQKIVHWSDPDVIGSAVVVAVVFAAIALSAWRTRTGWVGMLWFLAAIAVTLPLIPARNLLVAERYAYLPNIGIYWIIAAALVWAFERLRDRASIRVARAAAVPVCAAGAVAMICVSWITTTYYRNDVNKTGRVAHLYPDHPEYMVRHGWALYHAGDIEGALAVARDQLERHGAEIAPEAYQLIGRAEVELGRPEEGLDALHKAIEADPDLGVSYYELGRTYLDLDRPADAIAPLRHCVDLMPKFNPGLTRLANALRLLDRPDDARRVYDRILDNNPYDVFATTGIAELDIAAGRYRQALARLRKLLAWMPENVPARINAGVCLVHLGRKNEATDEYQDAIRRDPQARPAVLNLALLYISDGQRRKAIDVLTAFLEREPAARDALALASHTLVELGDLREAASLWSKAIAVEPDAPELLAGYAWVSMLAGQWDAAAPFVQRAAQLDPTLAEVQALMCVVHLRGGDADEALDAAQRLREAGVFANDSLTDEFCAMLDRLAADRPDDPWPEYVIALAATSAGRVERARRAAEAFKQRHPGADWDKRVDELLSGVDSTRPNGGGN